MTIFWVMLVVMVGVAIGFVIWPLRVHQQDRKTGSDRKGVVLDLFNEQKRALKRQLDEGELSSDQYQKLLTELQLSLLEDSNNSVEQRQGDGHSRWLIYLMVLLLPTLALFFYWQRGSIEDIKILDLREQFFQHRFQVEQQGAEIDPQYLQHLVTSLSERLEKKPDNEGNRYLLARAYMYQGAFEQAVVHYSMIVRQGQAPAHIVAELAQAVFLAGGNKVSPEVERLVAHVLTQDPDEQTALGLAGISAFEQKNYQAAIDYWGRAIRAMGTADVGAQSLLAGIERARQLLGESGAQVAEVSGNDSGADTGEVEEARIQIELTLSDSVVAELTDTVFVYARAWQGPKMPLAIARMTVADLPAKVELTEAMAMTPGMSIRSFPQLQLVARISKSGQPIAQEGDWQASAGPITLQQLSAPVSLSIEKQIP